MDFIWIFMLALTPTFIFILGIMCIIYYGTKRTFMVDDLRKYGGTITYQGTEYRIYRNDRIDVGLGYIVVYQTTGKLKFSSGNAFTQQPVVRIDRWR